MEIAPASRVASDPIPINLNPCSIKNSAKAASAAKIPATLLLAVAAAITLAAASTNFGLLKSRGIPSAKLKSSGPTNNRSAPSIAAMASTFSSAFKVRLLG